MLRSAQSETEASAAAVTAAILRFDIERLPRNTIALPYDRPGRLGEVAFVFFPEQQIVASAELTTYLTSLPKPVLLAALAHKGFVAAWWRDGQSDRALAAWDHNAANHRSSADRKLTALGIADGDLLLLETTQDRLLVSGAAFRYWTEAYGVDVLWDIVPLNGDPEARARIIVKRGDGSVSPGHGCAGRQ